MANTTYLILILFTYIIYNVNGYNNLDVISQEKMADLSDPPLKSPLDSPFDPSSGAFVRLTAREILSSMSSSSPSPTVRRISRDIQLRSHGSTFRTIEREGDSFDPLTQQRTQRVTLPPTFKKTNRNNNIPNEEAIPRSPPVTSSTTESPYLFSTTASTDPRCRLPITRGSCPPTQLRFVYSSNTKKCHAISWGCGGNANNFKSPEECKDTCKTNQVSYSLFSVPIETK